MNAKAPLRLILAALFFPAFGLSAQTNVAVSPMPVKKLPATSPYGEAIAIKNIPYVTNGAARQNLDLYLPGKKSDQPLPLIFWIHGGAWMLGVKDWDNVAYLVKHGYAIASIDYRFSTEAAFPAQIQDCNTALNFILAHASGYGIDPTQFVVAGGSAGGHLALLLGLARNQKDFGADPAIKPLAILDFFGPVDFTRLLDDLTAIHSEKGIKDYQDAVPRLLGAPVDQSPRNAKTASPITYVNAGNPPVLIIHGGKDPSVPIDQSRRLHDALDKAGVKNQLIVLDDAGHDGPLFSTPELQSQVVNFLDGIFAKPSQKGK